MQLPDDRLVAPLETLIQAHADRSESYRRAQQDTGSVELKSLFESHAARSDEFRAEWAAVLARQGEHVPTESSLTGIFQQAWMEFKAGLSGNDRETLLDSCLKLETSVLNTYQQVLDDWPEEAASWRPAIEAQAQEIRRAHDCIQALKSATHTTNS
jgi:uncharacterized protein (TIGR02284 family)